MTLALAIAFAAGILSFMSPCILPMLSVYFSLLTGLSTDELAGDTSARTKRMVIINTFLFVAGFTLVFTLAGWFAGQIGRALPGALPVLNVVGGVFVILLGLKTAGLLNLAWFERMVLGHIELTKMPVKYRYLSSFLVGLFFAVACSHCIAPTLYSILLYAGTTGSPVLGAQMMLAYSVGLAIPYILVGYSFSSAIAAIKKAKKARRWVSLVAGLLMVFLGYLMLTGRLQDLTGFLRGLIPWQLPFGM